MVTFKPIEIVDGFYSYEVYPEGNLHKKEVFEINPVTHELEISPLALMSIMFQNVLCT